MNGCIYRTKDGECELWDKDRNRSPFCVPDCTDKHPSNADYILAMSDEELAQWAARLKYAPNCNSKCHKDFELYNELRTQCEDCWLDWLIQEAAE